MPRSGHVQIELYSEDTPSAPHLEDVLEQLIEQLRHENVTEASRERSLVITKLEEALLWEQRRTVLRG